MKHLSKKRAAVAGVVASLALGGGAFAYFTAGGSGSGSATVGSPSGIEITQTNTLDALYPTTSQQVALKITNPGHGAQHVDDVHLASITADADHTPGCDVSTGTGAAFTMPDVSVDATLAADGGFVERTGTLTMNDTGVSQDDCQGATLTLHFTSN